LASAKWRALVTPVTARLDEVAAVKVARVEKRFVEVAAVEVPRVYVVSAREDKPETVTLVAAKFVEVAAVVVEIVIVTPWKVVDAAVHTLPWPRFTPIVLAVDPL
jgi:hypothetical protein